MPVEQSPVLDSDTFELCSFNAVSKRAVSESACEQALLGYVMPECCVMYAADESEDTLFSGPGGLLPEIKPILSEFRDVLVSAFPGGLPPERFGPNGAPIEHRA
jgi:hypothetical protein